MIQFLVYIVFHPQSDEARKLARSIYTMLNKDPVVPGLQIPTRFVNEDGTDLPPPMDTVPFDAAKKVFVLILADDYLNAGFDGKIPKNRKDWGPWVADIYGSCLENPRYRCLPFQLTKSAWPLDDRLSGVNFLRAWSIKEEDRLPWIEQRLLIELVRFFKDEEIANDINPKASLKVFISHTKIDINLEPKVVVELLSFLSQDKPVDAWFDSGDIPGGSQFAKEIAEGVENSILLCVLTDSYGSREWCQKEILLAKEKERPMIVVDALQKHESRSFPYIGNVPVLRWGGNAQKVISILFKETLRHFYSSMVLKEKKNKNDSITINAPELAVIVGKKVKTVLYPDPPV